jgi:hypothetical protein
VRLRGAAPSDGLLPLDSVDRGVLQLKDGSLRAILDCPTLAFGLKGQAEQRALAEAWASLLNSLDHAVQVVISTRQAAFAAPSRDKESQAEDRLRGRLQDSYGELLQSLSAHRAVVDRRFLMVIPAGGPAPARRLLGRRQKAPSSVASTDVLDQRLDWIVEGLRRLDINPSRLSTQDILHLFYRALCPETAAGLPLPSDERVEDFARVVAPAAFRESPAEVRLGNRLARTHAITGYPQLLRPAWIERLLGFDGDLDLSLHLHPAPSAAMMTFLSRRIAELSSTVRLSEEQGRRPDPYRRAALDDAMDLQDSLARGDQRLFATSFYATAFGESQEALDAASTRLEALLGSMLLHSRRLILQMEPGFISSLPLGVDRVGLQRYLTTSVLAATFPFTGSDLNSPSGLLYGVSPQSKSPVVLDNFALNNHNEVVFATSGAGKSYLAKLKLIRGHLAGIHFQVIDPEGEYVPIVEALGGGAVPLHPGVPVGLNAFAIPHDEPGALSQRIASLLTFFDLLAGGTTPNQRAVAEEALSFSYASNGYTDEGGNDKLTPPDLAEVHAALSRRADRWERRTRSEVEELALRLERYVSGAGRWLFAGAGEVRLGAGPTAYVLSGLPEEDRAPAMFLVLDHIWGSLAHNQTRLLIVVDEGWRLMQHSETARFVQALAKTLRKRNAGLLLLTQDVSDVLQTPVGEAVVTNASSQVLMRQAPQAMPRLTDLFTLTEAEVSWLLSAQQGEGLLLAAGKRVPFRTVASRVEAEIIAGAAQRGEQPSQ